MKVYHVKQELEKQREIMAILMGNTFLVFCYEPCTDMFYAWSLYSEYYSVAITAA